MDRAKPLISVIVPVYNTSEHLPKCIDSIIAQTYENLEIFLVNDGSSDNSGDICDAYAAKDPRIKVIHKKNSGVSAARNDALKIMTGEYVGFVDSDDTVSPNMYEELYCDLTNNGADVAVCRFNRIEIGEKQIEEPVKYYFFTPEEAIKNMLIGKYFAGQLCNKLFKSSLLDGLFLDESICFYEDLLITVEAFLRCKKICYSTKKLYNYFIRETSAVRSSFSEKHYTSHLACIKIADMLSESELDIPKEYTDTHILLCNLTLMHRLSGSAEHQKKYCPTVKSNITKHLNKKSFSRLSKGNKLKILIISVSYRLYFAFLKIYSRQSKNKKHLSKQKDVK